MSAPMSPEEDALRRRVKVELRKRMRGLRRAIPVEARQQRSARIVERLLALPAWTQASTVMLFMPMATEVDVARAAEAARAQGKRVAAPRMVETGLEVKLWRAEDEPVEAGTMCVPEPPESAPTLAPDEVDLIVVPALVLDERGARIGYGAGYYDVLLPSMPRAVRVGVAFDFQLVAEVPETTGDERVHVVITDERTLGVGAS